MFIYIYSETHRRCIYFLDNNGSEFIYQGVYTIQCEMDRELLNSSFINTLDF